MLRYELFGDFYLQLWMTHHAEQLVRIMHDNVDHIGEFLPFATLDYDKDDALEYINGTLEAFSEWKNVAYGIWHQDELIGSVGYVGWQWHSKKTEIGYWLSKDWTGHGVMTAAVRALTNYAIGKLGMNRIQIIMDIDNLPSAGVPKRIGYEFEGTYKSHLTQADKGERDFHFYTTFAGEWQDDNLSAFSDRGRDLLRYNIDEHLVLEYLLPHHQSALAKLVADNYDYLKPWIPWVKEDYSEDDAKFFIERMMKGLHKNKGFSLAILYDDEFVGSTSFVSIEHRQKRAELGYWQAESAQGKGIMTRVVKWMTDLAIREFGMNRVEILTDVNNVPSAKIPERLGYDKESVRKQYFMFPDGTAIDVNVYAMLAKNWQS